MMEQLLFPWHSSSTVLRASAILQEKPFNTPSLQSLLSQLMAANLSLANDITSLHLTHLEASKDSRLISGGGTNFSTGSHPAIENQLD